VIVQPQSVAELAGAVREAERVLPLGGGTKPVISASADDRTVAIDTGALCGVVAYEPGELTFTARAGTPVAELEAALGEHGQCLPFDPIMRGAGATIGGTIAAGVPGPGAYGSGVIRDFIIGVTVVDGRGREISGGGRVVKNAAGFDLPKLMVGSAGRLGVITEVSFKVFPRPHTAATVAFAAPSLAAGSELLAALGRLPLAVAALELEPPGRVLAHVELLDDRVARLRGLVDLPSERLADEVAAALWEDAVECAWAPAEAALLAAPTTLADLTALDAALDGAGAARRYGLGGRLAWIAWPTGHSVAAAGELLAGLGLGAVALRGAAAQPLLGAARGNAFADRVREALDPDHRFLELWP
jgi:glycolate oxidase FAD binding subunit